MWGPQVLEVADFSAESKGSVAFRCVLGRVYQARALRVTTEQLKHYNKWIALITFTMHFYSLLLNFIKKKRERKNGRKKTLELLEQLGGSSLWCQ